MFVDRVVFVDGALVDMAIDGANDHGGNVRNRARAAAVLATILLAACGDAPFASMGQRSSDWIAEPTVLTTTTIPTTVPVVIGAGILKWFNDGLGDA
ncbi:MAG: hypothetical protein ACRDZM_15250, partial [Acidimicrobiia bacterium]